MIHDKIQNAIYIKFMNSLFDLQNSIRMDDTLICHIFHNKTII